MDAPSFRIGFRPFDTVTVTYLRPAGERWSSWRVDASIAPFTGTFVRSSATIGLETFLEDLERMHATLTGEASFEFVEHEVAATASVNKLGHVRWIVKLRPSTGTTLLTEFEEDQTMLPTLMAELRDVLAAIGTGH